MDNEKRRHMSLEQLQFMANVSGYEIPADRAERVARQLSTILDSLDQLDARELHDVEPAFTFRPPEKT
jgi:Asp-tRNA(Asn)/Glu-tRNA(Gln) amidotransferase C subunit